MLPRGTGAILFTGASASVKGYVHSAAFAMGKFALRGLAQSMARELAPQGMHVAHFVIDGGIRSATRPDPNDKPDSMLDPDAIAADLLARGTSRAAPGPGRSSCAPGSSGSEPRPGRPIGARARKRTTPTGSARASSSPRLRRRPGFVTARASLPPGLRYRPDALYSVTDQTPLPPGRQ